MSSVYKRDVAVTCQAQEKLLEDSRRALRQTGPRGPAAVRSAQPSPPPHPYCFPTPNPPSARSNPRLQAAPLPGGEGIRTPMHHPAGSQPLATGFRPCQPANQQFASPGRFQSSPGFSRQPQHQLSGSAAQPQTGSKRPAASFPTIPPGAQAA